MRQPIIEARKNVKWREMVDHKRIVELEMVHFEINRREKAKNFDSQRHRLFSLVPGKEASTSPEKGVVRE